MPGVTVGRRDGEDRGTLVMRVRFEPSRLGPGTVWPRPTSRWRQSDAIRSSGPLKARTLPTEK